MMATTTSTTSLDSVSNHSRARHGRRTGSPKRKGLRGKRAPSSAALLQVEAARPLPRPAPVARSQSSQSAESIKLGLPASSHRRRVASSVNLADLLKRENSVTKLEPNGQPFSGSQRSSSQMPDLEASVHTSTSCASFASESFENLEDEDHIFANGIQGGGGGRVTRQSIRLCFEDLASSASQLSAFEDLTSSASQLINDDTAFEMEIYPGHYVPFQNASSVWKAVARGQGHTVEVTCLDCEIELVSVIDCEHIVCPECKMVNPVFESPPGVTLVGAGMGLKKEWVVQKSSSFGS